LQRSVKIFSAGLRQDASAEGNAHAEAGLGGGQTAAAEDKRKRENGGFLTEAREGNEGGGTEGRNSTANGHE